MTEDEVNIKCREYLEKTGLKYKGILNVGLGQVPVPLPDGSRSILIDHQGFNNFTKELAWVEAKGKNDSTSELLEGFIRVCSAVYYGGGNGYLAIPHAEYERIMVVKDFLQAVAEATNDKGMMGILDVETGEILTL